MKTLKYNYIVRGAVRGVISQHLTFGAAIRSLQKDQRECGNLGGGAYSDAEIERADGYPLTDDQHDETLRA